MNILAIGAHPDDIELGCAGTLKKYVKTGHNVYLCVLSQGSQAGDAQTRKNEQEEAALRLGVKELIWGSCQDTEFTVDQLTIWSERVGVPIVTQGMGADPASVAFDTLKSAVANHNEVVIIDTAGRLHNKINLMNELTKIKNVMQKIIPDAPHEILLILDASTGQNAIEQAKQFTAATEVNALALTKLDGTAKGGVAIGISDQFKIPVKYIGIGEQMEDLQIFNKFEFVDTLFDQ